MSPGARHRAGPAAQVLAGRARHQVPSRPQRVPGRQLQTSHTEPLIRAYLQFYTFKIYFGKNIVTYQYLAQSADDTHLLV